MATSNTGDVKTTRTSFGIISTLFEQDEATVEELEAATGCTNSTVHRHLTTLRDLGYVTKDGDTYRLSFRFLTVGGDLRRRISAYPILKTKVDDLAEQTGERAQFIIREGNERVYVYTETGDSRVQTGAYTGRRGPIHSSAAGKAIIANLPDEERERVLDSIDLNETGPNTITDKDELRAELDEIRERGYSVNLQESTNGVHAVGAVIEGTDDEIIGALSVSGPATRIKDDRLEREIPEMILEAKNEVELQIEHRDPRSL